MIGTVYPFLGIMSTERIERALRGATDTRRVVIEDGAIQRVGEVYAECFGDVPARVIADEITFDIAGREVQRHLASKDPYIFPGKPTLYGEYGNVEALETVLRGSGVVPVAVGSGTINDIVKLAAHNLSIPYLVVGTAASMDGYTSYGSAISREGFKLNFPCEAPRVVVGDLSILSNAPPKMTAAGYADLLCKVVAGADWIIADELGIEPIDPKAWSVVQDPLREWTAHPERLPKGDKDAIANLMEGLNMSGLAMQMFRSSRTAAGSEHQFSHLWEMRETEHGVYSHGFKVGVGSIASAALYERVMARDLSHLDVRKILDGWPSAERLAASVRRSHANPRLAESAVEHSRAKHLSKEDLEVRLGAIQAHWTNLRNRLENQMLPAGELRNLLRQAGCPTHPSEIGKDLNELKASYFQARQIRSRYTIFDLAAESGCFEECVEELFAPGGFWTE